jgi:hypothetical protein
MQNTLKCFLDFSDPYDKGCGEFSLVFMLTFMTFYLHFLTQSALQFMTDLYPFRPLKILHLPGLPLLTIFTLSLPDGAVMCFASRTCTCLVCFLKYSTSCLCLTSGTVLLPFLGYGFPSSNQAEVE